ncbi:MAG: DUF554 domain-containing protein [Bacteroidales bacterium]|nr:DUF554 domain-containing protein [Bacteroidales bacterium]
MTGTFINIATVLAGSGIGMILKTKLPEKIVKTVFQALGLFTLFLGFVMAMKTGSYLILVFSLVIGGIIGEVLGIEAFTEKQTERLKTKIKFGGEKFSEGMLTAFLLYCMGSMTILGALEEGMKGDATLLITKSVMDGFSSIALASAFGIGVAFSVIPMLLFQGGLTLFAMYFGEFIDVSVVNELTAVGGILLIGLGINILEIKKIEVFNLFPALIIAVLLAWIKFEFHLDF